MTGNLFLVLLTLAPLAGIAPVAMAGRFRPVPVISVAVAAELLLLIVGLLWSQALTTAARTGEARGMIAFGSADGGVRRVVAWLACCVFAALLADLVLFGHWLWVRT
jgi:hypothetical protein